MDLSLTITALFVLAQSQLPPSQSLQVPSPVLDALQTQVMLDRAGFSPGVIDGRMGPNTRKALEAYGKQHPEPDRSSVDPVTHYRITEDDVSGPFTPEIPTDLVQQALLPTLAYRNALEELAERFHATAALLQELNPGAAFATGDEIVVPNVEPFALPVPRTTAGPPANPGSQPTGTSGRNGAALKSPSGNEPLDDKPDVIVTVSKSAAGLTVTDTEGRVLLYAPVTTGSDHDPLPIGGWKVRGVQFNPKFNYNPDLFWDANPSHSKATIPPGPNNPVGIVWIDLSKQHYGLHGTPEPEAIGRTQSHGCVRLTNWDALKVAALVKPGTRVIFTN